LTLGDLVARAATRRPAALAVRGPDGDLSYGELDAHANRLARALMSAGVRPGDRVAIWLPKSCEAVVAMQAALRIGAAYVPVDSLSPAPRARSIMHDCAVRAVVSRPDLGRAILDGGDGRIALLGIDGLAREPLASVSADPLPAVAVQPSDLAYVLYTSGSTGRPKGVCISHSNALAFVNWAVDAVSATEADRFSNHAPFHFDLSVLDLYAAFSVGAAVCLVPEGAAYAAEQLVRFVREERITVWYSVPSAIVLMMDRGGLLSSPPDALRALLFAGEVFPMKDLRRLRDAWPTLAMWNLYGPTETNVCTAHSVGRIEAAQTSIPIGRATCGNRVWAKTDLGAVARPGESGELMVQGPTVFAGYWGQPPRGDDAYGTGDFVRVGEQGEFQFLGRRDAMVKIRGHRIELGEIEAALGHHPSVREAAAVVVGEGLSARLVAFLGTGSHAAPALLDIKRLCAERLPRYMIPDDAVSMAELPRNRNGKVDRSALVAVAAPRAASA